MKSLENRVDLTKMLTVRDQVISTDGDETLFMTALYQIRKLNRERRVHLGLHDFYELDNRTARKWGRSNKAEVIDDLQQMINEQEYLDMPPMPGSVEYFRALAEHNTLIVTTGRPDDKTKEATRYQFDKHFPGMFSEINHSSLERPKGVILAGRAAVHHEDHTGHTISVAGVDVQVVHMFHFPWSQDWRMGGPPVTGPMHVVHACDFRALARGDVHDYAARNVRDLHDIGSRFSRTG